MPHLFNISEGANIALHTMMLLAGDQNKPLPAHVAAKNLNLSQNHLAKVMQRLVHLGYVTSIRGPSGGFLLAKSPSSITLLEIYEAIDGTLGTHTCLLGNIKCHAGCPLGAFISTTSKELRYQLQKIHLSDVASILSEHKRKIK